ncbi:MAG: HAD-IIIC family phosphatase [Kiritimatiellae bacterium]|nr:HAD-IIIC family phosphatase [Kiritimatiellia bacterium]
MSEQVAKKFRVALVGNVALDFLAPYFRDEGFEIYVPSGFGTWPQELLDENSALHKFKPDIIFNVTEYDNILSKEVDGYFDERMKRLASMPYSLNGIKALIEELKYRLALSRGSKKKILAVDADETLWRGVIGEDGETEICECREFQQGLKELKDNGVLLVLLSKNDPKENFIPRAFALKDEDFAARKINWLPKAANLASACKELGLGVDSVLFLDDNPAERLAMSAALPLVAIVPWNGWGDKKEQSKGATILLRRLKEYAFGDIGKTEEDKLRASDYSREASRKLELAAFGTKEEYLKSLEIKVRPRLATRDDLPRLVQMAERTNQFNATTIRRNESSFTALLEDNSKKIFTFRARDKFGDQGLVCYIIVDLQARRITDFVMSCRAMARTIEYFALDFVEKSLGFSPKIDFVPSPKNKPFADFLSSGAKGGIYCEVE